MARGCSQSGALVAVYAVAVLAVPLAAQTPAARPGVAEPIAAPAVADRDADRDAVRALAGIWRRQVPGAQGDPMSFYYFHGDGKGLFRYGRIGLNNTHSFDYDVVGDTLVLHFRKTGRRHEVRFSVSRGDDGREWLSLADDPEVDGPAAYFRDHRGPIEHLAGPPPSGHMWIDFTRYATGGAGFHFYQLRPAGIDGRGVGWFHRGDFDDWSTQSLVYRITGDAIELTFPLPGEHHRTRFSIDTVGDTRTMTLASDPRDFGHVHTYVDAGPSFGGVPASLQVVAALAEP